MVGPPVRRCGWGEDRGGDVGDVALEREGVEEVGQPVGVERRGPAGSVHDLEVQVWYPVSILRIVAYIANAITFSKLLSSFCVLQAFQGEMPVQCKEIKLICEAQNWSKELFNLEGTNT